MSRPTPSPSQFVKAINKAMKRAVPRLVVPCLKELNHESNCWYLTGKYTFCSCQPGIPLVTVEEEVPQQQPKKFKQAEKDTEEEEEGPEAEQEQEEEKEEGKVDEGRERKEVGAQGESGEKDPK